MAHPRGWWLVLILIVLDHLIMLSTNRIIWKHLQSLNPYCIGSSNHAVHYFACSLRGCRSLNPYCIGSSNHAIEPKYVSFEQASLNPYCIGSSNHATLDLHQQVQREEVLILIVLDHLIMRSRGYHRHRIFRVLILIVLDHLIMPLSMPQYIFYALS